MATRERTVVWSPLANNVLDYVGRGDIIDGDGNEVRISRDWSSGGFEVEVLCPECNGTGSVPDNGWADGCLCASCEGRRQRWCNLDNLGASAVLNNLYATIRKAVCDE